MRREVRRTALGREFTSRSAVEVAKLTLNGVGLGSAHETEKIVRFSSRFELNHAPEDVHCETHRGAADRRADVVSGCRRSRTALALTLQQAIDLTHLFRRQRPVVQGSRVFFDLRDGSETWNR